MPKPTTSKPFGASASNPTNVSCPSLRPSKAYKELSSAIPLLAPGIVQLKLTKFEPSIKEGQDFNFMYGLRAELISAHPFQEPEGETADAGYGVMDNIWFGDKARDGKDMSLQRDRKMKELTDAFYTQDEQEEWGDDVPDLVELLQKKYGAVFNAELAIRPKRTNPETGEEYPASNQIKRYLPVD